MKALEWNGIGLMAIYTFLILIRIKKKYMAKIMLCNQKKTLNNIT